MVWIATLTQVEAGAADGSGGSAMLIIIGFMLLFLAGVIYVCWRAFKALDTKQKEWQRYKITLDMVRRYALQNADDRYFNSYWKPKKNAQIKKVSEWTETHKLHVEPLIGTSTPYMGHYIDDGGFYNFAFCAGMDYFVLPIVEVITVPHFLVHMQDDHIVINCVSVDRKSENTPYFPVWKTKDEQIYKVGYLLMEKFWDEKVSSQIIEQQGQSFAGNIQYMARINPSINYKNKTRGTDGGG